MARSDISASDVYVKHGRFCFGISPDVNAETSVTRFHSGEDTFIPGYIDIQFNGGFGVDFSDPNTITEAAIRDVLHKLLSRGVTALCATLISSAPSTFALVVPMFRRIFMEDNMLSDAASAERPPRARLIGLHFEGPFLSEEKRGAHAPACLRKDPSIEAMTELYSLTPEDWSSGLVRIVTLAPELPGALETIRQLAARGVVPAIGHTNADTALGTQAIDAGACLITHLYNAMRPLLHRQPGLVGLLGRHNETIVNSASVKEHSKFGLPPVRPDICKPEPPVAVIPPATREEVRATQLAVYASQPAVSGITRVPFAGPRMLLPVRDGAPFYSIIADRCHVDDLALAIAHRAHPRGAILITDAMRAMCRPAGTEKYGEMAVTIHAGSDAGDGSAYAAPHAVLAGTSTLAGAVAPMDDCVRNMVSAVGPSQTASVISASSAAPAVLLGLRPHADNDEDRLHVLGSLAPGAWADFLLVDAQLRVKETWLAGRRVWAAAADDGASTLSGVTGSGSASAVADGVGSAPSALATAQPG